MPGWDHVSVVCKSFDSPTLLPLWVKVSLHEERGRIEENPLLQPRQYTVVFAASIDKAVSTRSKYLLHLLLFTDSDWGIPGSDDDPFLHMKVVPSHDWFARQR